MEQETIVNSYKVRTALVIFLALAALFVGVQTVGAVRSWNGPYDKAKVPEIVVSGTGEKMAVPDLATVSFGVTEQAKTPKEAQDKVTDRMNKALAYLKSQGIAEKDMKTEGYFSNPRYEYQSVSCRAGAYCPPGRQVIVGYEVTHSVSVKVRDTNKAGDILGGLGGLNVQNLSGVQFTVEDPDKVRAEARADAIADAKAKAEQLAKDLGVRIVRITAFNEGNDNPIAYRAYDMKSAAGVANEAAPAPQVPAGENKYVSNVTITYEVR